MSGPPADAEALIAQAGEHRRAGRLDDAEQLYRSVLGERPDDPRAAFGLGVTLLQRKDVRQALPLLARAAERDAAGPQAFAVYVQALIADGQFERADGVLNDRAEPRPALELVLRQRWGMALLAQGDLASAEAQLARAADLAPNDPDAQADLGFVRMRQGRPAEAAAALERAIGLKPDLVGALVNLGAARKAQGRLGETETLYRRALAVEPRNAAALKNIGSLLNGGERHDEAIEVAEQALAAGPDAAALMVRGAARHGLGRYEDALADFRLAVELAPDAYEALTRIGMAEAALGRFPEALAALDAAADRRPGDSLAPYRRGPVRLTTGDFAGGWSDYEARWSDETFIETAAAQAGADVRARFDAGLRREDLAGRRVLLVGEQGIGDQVMFASMIPDLARLAAEVTCVCEPRLVRLFAASFPGVTFLAPAEAQLRYDGFDAVLAMGSLGRLFRNRPEDFPGAPYLRPSPAAAARWAARLGAKAAGGLRIGVSWRGGTPRTRRGSRSLPLRDLAAGLAAPGRRLVSLQYGDPRAEVAQAADDLGIGIACFEPEEITDFDDLAGLLAALDAVVTVQTAVAHLSGALGRPAYVLLPQVAEWRYMASGERMPWYGSVRLWRQPARGDWASGIGRISDAIDQDLGR